MKRGHSTAARRAEAPVAYVPETPSLAEVSLAGAAPLLMKNDRLLRGDVDGGETAHLNVSDIIPEARRGKPFSPPNAGALFRALFA